MTDRELFVAALDHADPAERAAWLDQACAADPDRRRRVEVLLRAHEDASRFLADPAGGPVSPDDPTRTHSPGNGPPPEPALDVLGRLKPADKPGLLGTLDHYEVIEVVGRGGMGIVLKAFDPKLHRLVALKLMAPHLAAHGAARKRFEREARAVAAVKNEHVVAIHAVQTNDQGPYLVMEFVGGISLQDRLDHRGPAEPKEVLRIGMQVARGLAAAHAQGVVHRDVKPANILLENGVERVKLTDFGLARVAADVSLTQSGVITGTPNYMSPEQATGRPTDARSDLFSLGGVLFALCTGHPPFRAETPLAVLRRVCDDQVRPPREVNPDVPDWLDAIVRKLLAKDPADRFQSANDVADLLGQHLAHLQQPTAVPMPATAAIAGTGERVWRQIFEATDRDRRLVQHVMLLIGLLDLGLTVLIAVTAAFPYPFLIVTAILAVVFLAIGGSERQRWDAPYKGRTIRFENSPFMGERLYVDGVRIARGGFGRMRELCGTLPAGPGAGDEVRVLCEAGLFSFKCRISASEGGTMEPSPSTPASDASPPGSMGWLFIIGGLVTLGLLLKSREAFWEGYFRPGYYAPISMLVTSAVLVAVLWWCRRRPEPAWYRGVLTLAMVIVVIGTGAGLLVSWGQGSYLDKLAGASAWQTAGFVAAAALVIVTNFVRLARWLAVGDAPRAVRAIVGAFVLTALIPFAGMGVAWWAILTGRWVPWTPGDEADAVGHLSLVKDDPDVDVIVERPGERLVQLAAGGQSSSGLPLPPDTAYTLTIRKGAAEVYTGVVRLKAGEHREIHVPPIVLPEKTIGLKPSAGSFPSDVVRVELSPDRSAIAVGRLGGQILVLDAASGKERFTISRGNTPTHGPAFGFTPDSKRLAYVTPAGGDEQVLRFIDATDGHLLKDELKPGGQWYFMNARALAFSPDGTRLAVTSATNAAPDNHWEARVFRWQRDRNRWRELGMLDGWYGMIESLRFTGDGSEVLAANGTNVAVGWSWGSGKESRRGASDKFTMDLIATGRAHEAVAGWSTELKGAGVNLWPSAAAREPAPTAPPLSAVAFGCLAFSPDDRLLAGGTKGAAAGKWEERAAVHVWDTKTGLERAMLLGHTDWPLAIAFDPTGRGLMTAGKDGTVRTWRLP